MHMKNITSPLTREQAGIVTRIRQLYRGGSSLEKRIMWMEHFRLYTYVSRSWSWSEAIEAAGLAISDTGKASAVTGSASWLKGRRNEIIFPDRKGDYGDCQSVLNELGIRYCLEVPLSVRAVQRGEFRDLHLLTAAIKHFGSWRAAVVALGVNYKSVLRPDRMYYSKETVIEGIQNRSRLRQSLLTSKLQRGHNRDLCLYKNALRFFGQWKNALVCAGINPKGSRAPDSGRYRTRADVITRLQRWQKSHRKVTVAIFLKGPYADPSLVYSARRLFKRWRRALKAAGVDPC